MRQALGELYTWYGVRIYRQVILPRLPIRRMAVDEAGPGEIIAVAGLEDVTIGETLADPDDPEILKSGKAFQGKGGLAHGGAGPAGRSILIFGDIDF